MKGLSISLVVVLALMLAGAIAPARSEMYKYRDAQGNVCYTDNLAQIPTDQRPGALTMETIGAGDAAKKQEDVQESDALDSDDALAPDEAVVDEETIVGLNTRKTELDDEFSGLMAEKYALLKEKQKLDGLAGRDVKARQAYEGKVADLNNRIADYATRRDAFQKECDRVKQVLEPTSPPANEEKPYEGAEASIE